MQVRRHNQQALVSYIAEGSSAQQAAVQVGDCVMAINGKPIEQLSDR